MRQRAQILFVIVPLVLSLGTPWGLLQSAAWVSMLVNYSRHATFAQAVSMTFDGKHPCRLCHAIQAGKAKEREQKKSGCKPGKELQLALPPVPSLLSHPPIPGVPAEPGALLVSREEPPPSPPPRLA